MAIVGKDDPYAAEIYYRALQKTERNLLMRTEWSVGAAEIQLKGLFGNREKWVTYQPNLIPFKKVTTCHHRRDYDAFALFRPVGVEYDICLKVTKKGQTHHSKSPDSPTVRWVLPEYLQKHVKKCKKYMPRAYSSA